MQEPSTKPTEGAGETSTRPITYIALAAIILLAAIAIATWSERSFKLKPASGSAAAMSLAAQAPAAAPGAPIR